jgi:murein DD-endopeptidase MepM/ murein hydrolase activator NlpD
VSPVRGGWRVLFVRGDGARSRSLSLRDKRVVATLLVATAMFGTAFTALGRLWRTEVTDARIAELEEQLAAAGDQTEQLRQLAARLERAESNYRQLRQIMGGEPTPSERDIELPALPAAREAGRADIATRDLRAIPSTWPVARRGFVSRSFEPERSGALGEHHGVDIAIPTGSYIRASGDGLVAEVGDDSVYGLYVRVAHQDGFESLYAHNSALFVAEGDSVEQNEVLALSGNTGRSSAPHLHFEIQKNGKAVDPVEIIVGGH